MKKVIVTITGPSCVGKSTLTSMLCTKRYGVQFSDIISTTTRAPRCNEQNGVHYHFVTSSQFSSIPMLETVTIAGHQYGASVSEVEKILNRDTAAVIVVDPHGARQIELESLRHNWKHISVFVDAPLKLLMERNLSRFLDDWRAATGLDSNLLNIYSSRFVNLVKEELQWSNMSGWNLHIPVFSPETQHKVIDDIEKLVLEKMFEGDANGHIALAH